MEPPNPTQPQPLPEIRDIAGPIDVFPYPLWMVIVASILAAVLLGVLVWLVVRWIRRRPAGPPPTPRQAALRDLDALRGQLDRMPPHGFSVEVSDVLRTFITAQYGWKATRQTSPEFLASISETTRFTDDEKALLANFLEHADLIKFADINATTDDSGELLRSAIAFVQGVRA